MSPCGVNDKPNGLWSWPKPLPRERCNPCSARLPRPMPALLPAMTCCLTAPGAIKQRVTLCSKVSVKRRPASSSKAIPVGQDPETKVTPSCAPRGQSSMHPLAETAKAPAASRSKSMGSNKSLPRFLPQMSNSPSVASGAQRTMRQFPVSAISTEPSGPAVTPMGQCNWWSSSPAPKPPATTLTCGGFRARRSKSATSAATRGNNVGGTSIFLPTSAPSSWERILERTASSSCTVF
mmetsp:Transcript_125463/g.313445  ORF Transcript_125463/g.313445 Transcript_125463/m.313445 type:complete len:236 (-) Transcript_125463:1032-1739(-)